MPTEGISKNNKQKKPNNCFLSVIRSFKNRCFLFFQYQQFNGLKIGIVAFGLNRNRSFCK